VKLLVTSDLHLEFQADKGDSLISSLPHDIDALVIAGDIHVAWGIKNALRKLSEEFTKVIFVLGNHDFYYCKNFQAHKKSLKVFCSRFDNLFWLDNSEIIIDGIHFLGGTLWCESDPMSVSLRHRMTDFQGLPPYHHKTAKIIPGIWKNVFVDNLIARDFIRQNATSDSIVITHHIPSWQSVRSEWTNSPLNIFYVSPSCEKIITEVGPRFWVHGHTHNSSRYTAGRTEVICNPFGYSCDLNYEFRNLIIEV